jgi:hypothetical protein
MKKILVFLAVLSCACKMFAMEEEREPNDPTLRQIVLFKKYNHVNYLPKFAKLYGDKFRTLELAKNRNAREMTAFLITMIAYLELVSDFSHSQTNKAEGKTHETQIATGDAALPIERAIEATKKAFERYFDHENLVHSIDKCYSILEDLLCNVSMRDYIQKVILADREPEKDWHKYRDNYSWNNVYRISEYEILNLFYDNFEILFDHGYNTALRILPKNLGKNAFNKLNDADNFFVEINQLELENLDYSEYQFFFSPWIEKLSIDARSNWYCNLCCIILAGFLDERGVFYTCNKIAYLKLIIIAVIINNNMTGDQLPPMFRGQKPQDFSPPPAQFLESTRTPRHIPQNIDLVVQAPAGQVTSTEKSSCCCCTLQ